MDGRARRRTGARPDRVDGRGRAGRRGPPEGIEVRRARPGDASGIRRIYNDAVRTTTATFDTQPRTLRAQRAWLRHHGRRHPALVALRDGRLIGWAALSPWSDRKAYEGTAEVSVYVDRRSRGKRVGTTLLRALLEEGRKGRMRTLLARIAEGNPASLRLHAAAGFRRVGTMHEVGFKFGRWVDVDLLEFLFPRRPRP